jgi:PhnB protein
MTIQHVNPYLMFNGDAEAALALYENALGAKRERVMRYGDAAAMNAPPYLENRIAHASARIGEATILMTDAPPNMPVRAEGNVQISLDFRDEREMSNAFDALAAGGKVTHPLSDMFWGAKWGTLTDAHGIRWMFNCAKQAA